MHSLLYPRIYTLEDPMPTQVLGFRKKISDVSYQDHKLMNIILTIPKKIHETPLLPIRCSTGLRYFYISLVFEIESCSHFLCSVLLFRQPYFILPLTRKLNATLAHCAILRYTAVLHKPRAGANLLTC